MEDVAGLPVASTGPSTALGKRAGEAGQRFVAIFEPGVNMQSVVLGEPSLRGAEIASAEEKADPHRPSPASRGLAPGKGRAGSAPSIPGRHARGRRGPRERTGCRRGRLSAQVSSSALGVDDLVDQAASAASAAAPDRSDRAAGSCLFAAPQCQHHIVAAEGEGVAEHRGKAATILEARRPDR